MPLLTVTCVNGRGGATTTALGAALAAPVEARPVLVKCDPSGGDSARRHRLAARPSMVDLAAVDRQATTDVFAAGVQPLRVGDRSVDVIAAPAGGAWTRDVLPQLSRPSQRVLNPPDRLVVADCGRFDVGSLARPLLSVSDVVMVLMCARADDLAHVHKRLGDLVDMFCGRLVVLLTPGGTYPAVGVAEVLGRYLMDELARAPDFLTVAGPLPQDRRGADVLRGERAAGHRWLHLPLPAALQRIMSELAPQLDAASRNGVGVPTRDRWMSGPSATFQLVPPARQRRWPVRTWRFARAHRGREDTTGWRR